MLLIYKLSSPIRSLGTLVITQNCFLTFFKCLSLFRNGDTSKTESMIGPTNWSSISSLPCDPVTPTSCLTSNLIEPRRIPRARRSFSLQMDKIQMLKKDWESFCDIQECENVWHVNALWNCLIYPSEIKVFTHKTSWVENIFDFETQK